MNIFFFLTYLLLVQVTKNSDHYYLPHPSGSFHLKRIDIHVSIDTDLLVSHVLVTKDFFQEGTAL